VTVSLLGFGCLLEHQTNTVVTRQPATLVTSATHRVFPTVAIQTGNNKAGFHDRRLGAGPLDSEANRRHFDKDQSVKMPGGAGHAAVTGAGPRGPVLLVASKRRADLPG